MAPRTSIFGKHTTYGIEDDQTIITGDGNIGVPVEEVTETNKLESELASDYVNVNTEAQLMSAAEEELVDMSEVQTELLEKANDGEVTQSDIQEGNEAWRNSIARLTQLSSNADLAEFGYRKVGNEAFSNPNAYARVVALEGIGDWIKKILAKVKEAFRKAIQGISRIAAKVVLLFQKYFNGAKKLKEAVSKLSVSEGGVLDATSQREVVNKLAAMEFFSGSDLAFDDSFGSTLGNANALLKKIGKNETNAVIDGLVSLANELSSTNVATLKKDGLMPWYKKVDNLLVKNDKANATLKSKKDHVSDYETDDHKVKYMLTSLKGNTIKMLAIVPNMNIAEKEYKESAFSPYYKTFKLKMEYGEKITVKCMSRQGINTTLDSIIKSINSDSDTIKQYDKQITQLENALNKLTKMDGSDLNGEEVSEAMEVIRYVSSVIRQVAIFYTVDFLWERIALRKAMMYYANECYKALKEKSDEKKASKK